MLRTLIAAFFLISTAPSQPLDKQADVDRIFSAFNTHTPGCAVGVARNGVVVLKSGYGMADLERDVAITPDTIFESGSVAKQFTAAAVMLLAQQGKISLDDAVRKYIPELPDYGKPLTIRHVLSHLSGLREWREIATFGGLPEDVYVYSNRDILQLAVRQHALNFAPGSAYSYSNTGFNILPTLMERALGSGQTFQSFTKDNIFVPLGMDHSVWRDDFRAIVPRRALAYDPLKGASGWTQNTPIENIIGAGGLLTTVGDLLLWNENFTHAKVGGPAFVKAQQTPATLNNGHQIAYAAGLTISTVNGIREVSHGGATGGYRTWLGRYPDQAVSVAVLCNSASANPSRLGRDTAALWTGVVPVKQSAPPTTDSAKLQGYVGMYRNLRDNTVASVKWVNGKLSIRDAEISPVFEEGTPLRMRITSPDTEVLYERVEPAHPTQAELADLAGEYESHETGAVLIVEAGGHPAELTYRIGSNPPLPLNPTFRDAFETAAGASIHFIRDPSGKVIALSAGDDRVWDLRFKRLVR